MLKFIDFVVENKSFDSDTSVFVVGERQDDVIEPTGLGFVVVVRTDECL